MNTRISKKGRRLLNDKKSAHLFVLAVTENKRAIYEGEAIIVGKYKIKSAVYGKEV